MSGGKRQAHEVAGRDTAHTAGRCLLQISAVVER
jgi:hypothetical protein